MALTLKPEAFLPLEVAHAREMSTMFTNTDWSYVVIGLSFELDCHD